MHEFFLGLNCALLLILVYNIPKRSPQVEDVAVTKREHAFNRYASLLAVLEYSKKYAYNKIFEKYLLVNSGSGVKLNGEEAKKAADEYVKLVFKHCGPAIVADLELVHGNLDAMCLILVSEFMQRLVDDEVLLIKRYVENEVKSNNEKELPDRISRLLGASK